MRTSLRLLLTALCAIAFAGTATAQSLTGGIVFEVVEAETGEPVPGVAITLDSPQLQGFQFKETDANGRARFLLLPPGDYLAEFIGEDYATFRQSFRARPGSTDTIVVAMTPGALEEQITVRGETPIDPTDSTVSSSFDSEFLENVQIGSGSRSYQSVLQQAPGVAGGSNPAVHGATLGENRYLLDGVDSTDPVTGTFGQNLMYDTIQTIDFYTGGFRAEHGLASGGLVNVVTKSGGNEVSGSLDIRYSDEGFIDSHAYSADPLPSQESRNIGATLGGYIAKDKLWYFLAYADVQSEITPADGAATRVFDGGQRSAKLTWLINPDHRVALQYTTDPADISHANASLLVAPEAGRFQEQDAEFVTGTYFGRLSDKWSLTVLAGTYESTLNSFPMNDLETVALSDLGSGMLERNYTNAQYSDRLRDQFSWNVEYISDGGAGSSWHDVKFGMEWQDTEFSFESFTPGGRVEYWDSRVGDRSRLVRIDEDGDLPGRQSDTGTVTSFFVQDTWHLNDKLTLDLGLRLDRAVFENDVKTEIADMRLIQPRFGVSYDVLGNARHVVRFSAGRYMHPGILTLPNALNERASTTTVTYEEEYLSLITGADWDCENGFEGDEMPNEQELNCEFTFGGPSGTLVSDDLDPTYVDEISLGYDVELKPNMTLKSRLIFRNTDDIWEDRCLDDDCDEPYIIDNIAELERRYRGLEFEFAWNPGRWHVFSNYTISSSKGNVEYTQGLGVDWDAAIHRENRFGHLSTDATHRLRFHGWVDIPRDWEIAWDGSYRTGIAFTRTLPAAPYGTSFPFGRGSHRTPELFALDVEARKNFTFEHAQLTLIASIENLFQQNEITTFSSSFVDPDGMQEMPVPDLTDDVPVPTTYYPARSFEVGLRLTF